MENSSIIRIETDEEKRLQQKLLELKQLKSEALDKELILQQILADLEEFRRDYDLRITLRQKELDAIHQMIEDFMLTKSSQSVTTEIRAVYRRLAKLIHPDLGSNPDEMEARRDLMSQANRAFEDGDIETLKSMLIGIECQADSNCNGLLASRIEFIRLQISDTRKRLAQVSIEIARTTQSELYQLMSRQHRCLQVGKDYLSEIAIQLEAEIEDARSRLNAITSREDQSDGHSD
ncbi:MAG: J domain-containing protein [Cyanobacteria bacterium]|nr:J domain-containing protein [Cyanobacteriota bacterium]